jgi:twitching motility protein PilT
MDAAAQMPGRSRQLSRSQRRKDAMSQIFINLGRVFTGHQRDVTSVAFSPDEKMIISGGGDQQARIWSRESREAVKVLNHGSWINAVAMARGVPVAGTAGRDGLVKLWNLASGAVIDSVLAHQANATTMAFFPDGMRLISGGQEGKVKFYSLRQKRFEADVQAHSGWVWRVTTSEAGNQLLTAGADCVARVWLLGRKEPPISLKGHEGEVVYGSFSRDGLLAATCDKTGCVKVWRSASGELVRSFRAHEGAVNSVNFSPSGAHLVTAGADKMIKVWVIQDGSLSAESEGGYDYISECVFSPSGKQLASCGGEGLVKLWEVSDRPTTVAMPELEKAARMSSPSGEIKRDPLLQTGPLTAHAQSTPAPGEIKRDPLLETGPLAGLPTNGGGPLLHRLLKRAVQQQASDIHVPSGASILTRIHGRLKPLGGDSYTPDQIEKLLMEVLTDEQRRRFTETNDLDFSYEVNGVGRFRANVCRQHRGVDGSFRVIPDRIASPDELGLPSAVPPLTRHHQGLVLITGPAGQGKSTTIATLVDLINSEKRTHIITVEDPIEFIHPIKQAVVNQREVGKHTLAFANALRAALREDPDVIVVGEMRDLETMSLAITAAETGHLVFASLMTTDAAQTIDRILDSFPPGQQAQIRTMLSESLKGVISQQLIPAADGNGRVLACEVLLCNVAVGNMIRERKTFQLGSVMQTGRNLGMQRMDDALADLFQAGKITRSDAVLYSQDPKALEQRLAKANQPAPSQPAAAKR